MKKITLLAFLFISSVCFSQKQIFETPQLKSTIKLHKVVAILPFTVKISYKKQPKNFSEQANKEQEIKMSKSIQSSMYTFLLRKKNDYSSFFVALKSLIFNLVRKE